MAEENITERRPLKSRDTAIAKKTAHFLTTKEVDPNSISIASIGFAVFGGLAFWGLRYGFSTPLCLIAAVVGIQGRLLCNLLDGMVAIEGGRSSPLGGLYNEVPDRIADSILIICAGYIVSGDQLLPVLAWSAALLALFTAYIRALGASLVGKHTFRGPMAKPHRMALLSGASMLGCLIPFEWLAALFRLALIVMNIGCILTLRNRLVFIAKELKGKC